MDAPAGLEWYVTRNGQRVGPILQENIERLHSYGRLQASDLVWSAKLGEWKNASEVFDFAPPPLPPPLPSSEIRPPPISEQTKYKARRPAGSVLGWLTLGLGALLSSAAIAWWAIFYTAVLQGFSDGRNVPSLLTAKDCLFSASGPCAVVSTLAQLGGGLPYQPLLFWLGATIFVIGAFIVIVTAER